MFIMIIDIILFLKFWPIYLSFVSFFLVAFSIVRREASYCCYFGGNGRQLCCCPTPKTFHFKRLEGKKDEVRSAKKKNWLKKGKKGNTQIWTHFSGSRRMIFSHWIWKFETFMAPDGFVFDFDLQFFRCLRKVFVVLSGCRGAGRTFFLHILLPAHCHRIGVIFVLSGFFSSFFPFSCGSLVAKPINC